MKYTVQPEIWWDKIINTKRKGCVDGEGTRTA